MWARATRDLAYGVVLAGLAGCRSCERADSGQGAAPGDASAAVTGKDDAGPADSGRDDAGGLTRCEPIVRYDRHEYITTDRPAMGSYLPPPCEDLGSPSGLRCPASTQMLFVVDNNRDGTQNWFHWMRKAALPWLVPDWRLVGCESAECLPDECRKLTTTCPDFHETIQTLAVASPDAGPKRAKPRGQWCAPPEPPVAGLSGSTPAGAAVKRIGELLAAQPPDSSIGLAVLGFDGVADDCVEDRTGVTSSEEIFVEEILGLAKKNIGVFVCLAPQAYRYVYVFARPAYVPYVRAILPKLQEALERELKDTKTPSKAYSVELFPGDPCGRPARVVLDAGVASAGRPGSLPPGVKVSSGEELVDLSTSGASDVRIGIDGWTRSANPRGFSVRLSWGGRGSCNVLSAYGSPKFELVGTHGRVLKGWTKPTDQVELSTMADLGSFGVSQVYPWAGTGCAESLSSLAQRSHCRGLTNLRMLVGLEPNVVHLQLAWSEKSDDVHVLQQFGIGPSTVAGDASAGVVEPTQEVRRVIARAAGDSSQRSLPAFAVIRAAPSSDSCVHDVASAVSCWRTAAAGTCGNLSVPETCAVDAAPLKTMVEDILRVEHQPFSAWCGNKQSPGSRRMGAATLLSVMDRLAKLPRQDCTAGSVQIRLEAAGCK